MKPAAALADRLARYSLWILAAANVLFLLSFLAAATLAAGQAHAGDPTSCNGRNIVAQLARDNPQLLQKIRAEAAATPNGRGLLWKVEKDGVAPSWLFGTMHMTDPRVARLPAKARDVFDTADTVAIETTDILDQRAMAAAMLEDPELMMFTDGSTLTDRLSAKEQEAVREALKARGIPLASVKKMKPWMLASLVALPACELKRKSSGAKVLDVRLAAEAKADGKTLKGLETVTEQLSAMASLPMELHMRGLVETLKLGRRNDDMIETMIVLYNKGETGMFWPLFDAVLPSGKGEASDYARFREAVVKARNHTMLERAEPILDRGDAFIAVGALHLPGKEGLVALLRKAGYTVTAAD